MDKSNIDQSEVAGIGPIAEESSDTGPPVAGEVSPRHAKPQASLEAVFGHSCNFTPAVISPRVMLPVVDNSGMMHACRAW